MYIELENGQRFYGKSFGYSSSTAGEVVFQTGMVGYPESLTDPSYNKQILVLTYPLIGNYGIPNDSEDNNGLWSNFESNKIWISGLVVGEYTPQYSHWRGVKSLGEWLKEHKVPAISGIDTRQLTLIIREHGTIKGKLVNDENDIDFLDIDKINLVRDVSQSYRKYFPGTNINVKKVLVYDFGIKNSQIRSLIERDMTLTVVPWNYVPSFEMLEEYDGIFLSNGPGDPRDCQFVIEFLREVIDKQIKIPIFGICLGHQILSLAGGSSISKMKFGNRGHNIPVRYLDSERCLITSQNHGYAVENIPDDWTPLFTNANDNSNEGVIHKSLPYFSVQFHPEAKAGPSDANFLFDIFRQLMDNNSINILETISSNLLLPDIKENKQYKKILILGSGGLTIGQSGEFDYSGSQAIKAYKEAGIQTVLVNPNIATIQTSVGLADKIYSLPVTLDFVSEIIKIERPDGIALSFGGQTALNTGIQLYKSGILKEYNIDVLGTSIESIESTEDRQMFKDILQDIGEKVATSWTVNTIEDAIKASNEIGYPVLIRTAFALGGLGSGFAKNESELIQLVESTLSDSKAQVIIDKSFKGWKEVEYELVRDKYDNCISVCNMENLDPLGVHTGESIVVAPSQTLTDEEYYKLRRVAFKIIRKVNIIGECNIQYALDPNSDDYFIIEMNARLSRSSALASKATGYPLAYVAAKLSLGESLISLKNSVTKTTTACFEPSLDYCVVKVPRWDLNKFPMVSKKIGSSMKSVGEVMAIARSFEEALQKGLRMANESSLGFDPFYQINNGKSKHIGDINMDDLENPTYDRIFLIAQLMYHNMKTTGDYDIENIHNKTKIDYWFLKKFEKIIDMYFLLEQQELNYLNEDRTIMLKAKRRGFSDLQISKIIKVTESYIRNIRLQLNITPWIKIIDTVAGEFRCETNYCYLTYHGNCHDIEPIGQDSITVLGSGVYRIGSSVEFDWCAVNCIRQIREVGYKAIMINYNPETVSTDYDEADRLYFEELSFEVVMDIYQFEDPKGVILSMGGQIPNNIAMDLYRQKVRVLGTSPENIDQAENRFKFSRLLDQINVDQPKWKESIDLSETIKFCHEVDYPCLIRPSYVLSGAAMKVIYSDEQLEKSLTEAAVVSKDYPVVISKFIDDAKEIEVDAVANNGWVEVLAISEHVENAGVHSGDATLILPSQNITAKTMKQIRKSVYKISQALKIHGPFNIQFIAKDDSILVIECNLRVSRTFPFISKTLDANFIKIATNIIIDGEKTDAKIIARIQRQETINGKIGVKVPQFSFNRLIDTDVKLGVEMVSTGEVACFGRTQYEAYLKALRASGFKIPDMTYIKNNLNKKHNILITVGSYRYKKEFESYIEILSHYFNIYTTYGTYDYYTEYFKNNSSIVFNKFSKNDDVIEYIKKGFFIMIISISDPNKINDHISTLGYSIRTTAVKFNIPVVTNIKCSKLLINALVNEYDSYTQITDLDCMTSYNSIKMPMLMDIHTHFRDFDEHQSGDWKSESKASLIGGVSTVMVMPNTKPPLDNYKNLVQYNELAECNSQVNYLLTILGTSRLANIPNIKEEMNQMAQLAIGMKLYLSDSHISNTLTNIHDWEKLLSYWPSNRLVFIHVDNPIILMGFLFIARKYPHHYHLCHLRTRQELEIISKAKINDNMQITCEVCPHHLFLNSDNKQWNQSVMPYLINKDDIQYLLDNLNQIDCFASDHAPHHTEGNYGISSIESTMKLYGNAINSGIISLDILIEKMVTNPYNIIGLQPNMNTYMEVDFECSNQILPKYSKGKNNPYLTWNTNIMIRRTVVNGVTVAIDEILVTDINGGNLLVDTKWYQIDDYNYEISSIPLTPSISTVSDSYLEIDIINKSPVVEFNDKDIISIKQFNRSQIRTLCIRAQKLEEEVKLKGKLDILNGKIITLAFLQPSTRTKLSFEAAIIKLGGSLMSLDPSNSSIMKGESLRDTIKTIETYSDGIILRSSEEGIVKSASQIATIPVINAGDGCGEHPTQALLDVYTIRQERGSINNRTITFMGDLKNGRTVHSLVRILAMYDNTRFYYLCDEALMLPIELQMELTQINPKLEQHYVKTLEEVLPKTDVLYVTRLQKEYETEKLTNYYYPTLTPSLLANAKKDLIIMHPLPRNNEIDIDVDIDPRACYFRQMNYGLYMRMALLEMLFK